MSKEEVFLRDVKKTKRSWKIDLKINFEDQKWIYYLIFGSFVMIVLLNYTYPSVIERPTYEIKTGFFGMILTVLGGILIYGALQYAPYGFLNGLIIIVIVIALLYFGLPLLLQW
jgi:uncharacterized protein YacL